MLGYPIEEAIPVGASNVSPFAYEVEAPVPGAAAEVGAVEGATGYLGAAATGAAIGAGVAAVLFAGYAFYSASCTLQ